HLAGALPKANLTAARATRPKSDMRSTTCTWIRLGRGPTMIGARRRDVVVLGELRRHWRPQWPRPAAVAALQRRARGPRRVLDTPITAASIPDAAHLAFFNAAPK